MEKITGSELRKELSDAELKLKNITHRIHKKFDLYIEKFPQYIPVTFRTYLQNNSIYDLDIQTKLDIIIQTEDNYVVQSGKQGELFD